MRTLGLIIFLLIAGPCFVLGTIFGLVRAGFGAGIEFVENMVLEEAKKRRALSAGMDQQ